MGLVYADIEVINWGDLSDAQRNRLPMADVRRMTVTMLVDSGAYFLALNQRIVEQLGLLVVDQTTAELADGTILSLDVVGPVEVRFANRRASVDAVVLPGDAEPLLGAIPMESMDVLVDPKREQLVVNPKYPFKKGGPLK